MSHFDENLTPVLSLASNADLEPLVEYISKASLSETLTNNDLYKKHTPNHKEYVELVEREIRKFGGNTIISIYLEIMVPNTLILFVMLQVSLAQTTIRNRLLMRLSLQL